MKVNYKLENIMINYWVRLNKAALVNGLIYDLRHLCQEDVSLDYNTLELHLFGIE